MESIQPEKPVDMQPENNKRSGVLHLAVDILETLLLSLALFVGINAISARIRVDGASMEPTLTNGELVLVSKLAYRLGTPSRGDIIVFHFPRDPQQEYIKRIIGLPGDQVWVVQGQVFVNEVALDEPYVKAPPNYPGNWTVPAGELFVLGDNRNNSSDSHEWGTVPMNYVIGKAALIYWPPEGWGLIEHFALAAETP